MKRKKKTTIVTLESRERMTIRHSGRHVIRWCERCHADVVVLTAIEAAAIAQVDAHAIFRQVEQGEIHFIASEGDALLVCSNSLSRAR